MGDGGGQVGTPECCREGGGSPFGGSIIKFHGTPFIPCFPQAAKLPMSIIIVGVGQAEFDGKIWGLGELGEGWGDLGCPLATGTES